MAQSMLNSPDSRTNPEAETRLVPVNVINPFSPPRPSFHIRDHEYSSQQHPRGEDVPPPMKRKFQGNPGLPIPVITTPRPDDPRTSIPSPTSSVEVLSICFNPNKSPNFNDILAQTAQTKTRPLPNCITIEHQPVPIHCENIRNPNSDTDDCPHASSFQAVILPEVIISNYSVGKMLTCLRQVATRPADIVSPAVPHNSRHRIRIYACYQQHWYPKTSIPVLTLVAPCGVTISPPIFKRKFSNTGTVKFMVSSAGEQELLKFPLPLNLTRTLASSSIVMTHGPSSSCPDTYTSYLLKTTSPEINITWIKVFHLSVLGCFTLHTRSLYVPPRPACTSELHILGLTAARQTSYDIVHHSPMHIGIKFLQEEELLQIGWKRNPPQFTVVWTPNEKVFIAPTPLMEQMQFTKPSYFPKPSTMCHSKQEIIPISDPAMVPLHYPPTTEYIPPCHAMEPKVYFEFGRVPPGLHRMKDMITPVKELIENLTPPLGFSKDQFFLSMFNVPISSLHSDDLDKITLLEFLDKYATNTPGINPYCRFRHFKPSKEPYHYSIPRSWMYITDHPDLQAEAQRNQFPTTERHDHLW